MLLWIVSSSVRPVNTRMVTAFPAGSVCSTIEYRWKAALFFRQPKVTGQAIPYFKILVILKTVPVDRIHPR